jgi:hypothetical protein
MKHNNRLKHSNIYLSRKEIGLLIDWYKSTFTFDYNKAMSGNNVKLHNKLKKMNGETG